MHLRPDSRTCLRFCSKVFCIAAVFLFTYAGILHAQAPVATTTTLTSSSTSLDQGTTLTLTAKVSDASGNPVTAGAVKFCRATATRCDDAALLGRVQLISTGNESGQAVLRIRPGAGSHAILASFVGTSAASASNSEAQTITISRTGILPAQTNLSVSGPSGNYTLTATATANGTVLPTGSFRFLDTSNSNYVLGTASVDATNAQRVIGGKRSFTVGENPLWVSVGDFNEDGIPDFVVANMTTTNLSVMLGDGNGGFSAASGSPIPVGSRPKSIAVGDFNSDGHLDLAVAHDSDGCVMVLLGDGTGKFTQAPGSPYSLLTSWGAKESLETVVAADFNGDGNLDWAVVSFGGQIDLALGDGAGGFTLRRDVADAGMGGNRLEVADFNNDGIPDLLATNRIDNQSSVFLGDGTGAFSLSSGSPYSLGDIPQGYTAEADIVAADLNGDGFADFAFVNSPASTLSIMLGDGTGNFTSAPALPTLKDGYPRVIRVADINGDGIPDLVVSGLSITPLFGDGHGGFTAGDSLSLYYSFGLAAADVNGDGADDMISANFEDNTADLVLGQVAGAAVLSHISIPGFASYHSVTAEYSGDSNYQSGTSNRSSVIGTRIPATLTLTASPADALNHGQLLTLSAAVSPVSKANYTAEGSIDFYDGADVLCSSVAIDRNGTAVCSVSSLSVGSHSLAATYQGNENFAPAASKPLVFTVNQTAITLTMPASTLTLKRGEQGTLALSALTTGNLTGKLAFSCTGLPAGASCAFSPSTVEASDLPKLVSVTIKTSAPTGSPLLATVLLTGVLLPAGTAHGKRRLLAFAAAVGLLLVFLVGCGGGGTRTPTPAGNYNVVVTATANGTTQGWATINLSVTE